MNDIGEIGGKDLADTDLILLLYRSLNLQSVTVFRILSSYCVKFDKALHEYSVCFHQSNSVIPDYPSVCSS